MVNVAAQAEKAAVAFDRYNKATVFNHPAVCQECDTNHLMVETGRDKSKVSAVPLDCLSTWPDLRSSRWSGAARKRSGVFTFKSSSMTCMCKPPEVL
mmetsp:Transcript_62380/g.136351  ORF Transcript_62380/g.136351 Transcript_62380/m.136351 type:complete len:97 (-) Transcript_62380:52-342(-)